MKNKTYDYLKFIALVVMPAVTTFIGTLLEVLNVSCCSKIVIIMSAFNVMLGTIIGKLSLDYKKQDQKLEEEIKTDFTYEELEEIFGKVPEIPKDIPLAPENHNEASDR